MRRRTEEGQALYSRTVLLLSEIEETAAAIALGGELPQGRLRLSAPLLFPQAAMGKLAAGFALKYPEVRLEVTTEDRPVDMVEEGYDLVIRVNPDHDESLIGRIFLRDRLVVVASPALLRPSGGAAVPAVARGATGQRSDTALWALYPSRRLLSARVSAFLGFLKEAFPNGTPDELASYITT
jgi:DNA-binding transcriptional LysR family regulator